jgi:hypothetical protein
MAKNIGVRNNVKLLAEREPEVKDNYNLLLTRYWEKFESANQVKEIVECTSAESITRAFRALVKSGDIVLKEEIKKIRQREQKQFQKEYGKQEYKI